MKWGLRQAPGPLRSHSHSSLLPSSVWFSSQEHVDNKSSWIIKEKAITLHTHPLPAAWRMQTWILSSSSQRKPRSWLQAANITNGTTSRLHVVVSPGRVVGEQTVQKNAVFWLVSRCCLWRPTSLNEAGGTVSGGRGCRVGCVEAGWLV